MSPQLCKSQPRFQPLARSWSTGSMLSLLYFCSGLFGVSIRQRPVAISRPKHSHPQLVPRQNRTTRKNLKRHILLISFSLISPQVFSDPSVPTCPGCWCCNMSTDNPPLEQLLSVGLESSLKVTKPSDQHISSKLFVQHGKRGFPPSFRSPCHLPRGSDKNYLGSPWIIISCRYLGVLVIEAP